MNHPQLIVHEKFKSPIAEAYRTLRTNLQFTVVDGMHKSLLFTSAGPGEGKSTTAANTAISLAQNGKKVILMDCDLRKPVQHTFFGLSPRGVTNILAENVPAATLLQETMVPNLKILAAGPIPPNPLELLDSAKMDRLIEVLKQESDYLIFDAPPLLAVTDAGVIASKVDGVVMVISIRAVRPEAALRAKEQLARARGNLIGVVLNKVEVNKREIYYHYYYQNTVGKR